jgi:hypothetical protein
MGGGGVRKGGGGNATTSHGRRQEAAARWQAEAPADRRQLHDEMQRNNQPGWMRGNYTRELEGHDGMQGLKWWQDG